MVIIRRIIVIIVLLGLAFVFYRFLNPEGADKLISRFNSNHINSVSIDPQDDSLTGDVLTGEILTGALATGTVVTGEIITGTIVASGQTSGETIGVVENMQGFTEVLDDSASAQTIKGDLKYINTDYKFSMTFPGSRDGYTLQINTGDDVKAEFIFAFDSKDYFLLYVIPNTYYQSQKTRDFGHLTYLAQDTTNTFAYKILENTDTKSKAIPYIIKTFKLSNPMPSIPTTVVPTTVKTTTVKKTTSSDGNYIRNIFDSFVK